MPAAILIVLLAAAAATVQGGVVLEDGVLTSGRPIWELVRSSDALRAFLEHHAAAAPGAVGVVVDAGSVAALRRAKDAIADLRRADVNATGPFILATFHRSGVAQPRVLSSWSELQQAVAAVPLPAAMPAGQDAEGRGAAPGPLDAVLGVAGVAPRGTRIVLVTEHGAEGEDSEAAAVADVGRALKRADIQLDAWALGDCSGYRAVTSVSKTTGGSLGCGELWPAGTGPKDGAGDGVVDTFSPEQRSADSQTLKEVTLAKRQGLTSPLQVHVDSSVAALQAVVRGAASLRAPSGRSWSLGGQEASTLSLDGAQLRAAAGTADGPWVLTPLQRAPVDVEVRARSGLDVAASLLEEADDADDAGSAARQRAAPVTVERVRLQEPQGVSISSVRLLDESGRELGVAARSHPAAGNATKQVARRAARTPRTEFEEESEWEVHSLPGGKPSLVETTGHNSKGEVFTRVANLTRADNILLVPPPLDIELNPNTQLLVRQGQTLQMSYDVTNNRDFPQLIHFNMKDELAFLVTMIPNEALIAPRQTVQVVGNLVIKQNAGYGQNDKVTFIARSVTLGQQETRKTAILYLQQEPVNDVYNPTIWATWKSTCTGAWDPSNCNTNIWTIDFEIQDKDSGLLSITSNPRGVQFRNQDFISGTRDPVRAYYSASCCAKRVDIVATDLRGNSVRQSFDVGSQFLSPGDIAGISMGVICILLIVAIIVLAILLCRRRESLRLERRLSSRLARERDAR